MTGKEDVRRLIDLLRQQNVDLLHAREQRNKLAKPQRLATQLFKPPNLATPPRPFQHVRDMSKVLYEGLSATNICSCHAMNLQLDGHIEQTNGPSPSVDVQSTRNLKNGFHFLITKSIQTSDTHEECEVVECTQFTLCSEGLYSPVRKGAKDLKAPIMKGHGRIRFAVDDQVTQLHGVQSYQGLSDDATYTIPEETQAIQSLCSLLAQPLTLCRPVGCLGILRGVEAIMSATTCRNLMLSESNPILTSCQTSLEDILPKKQLLSREERLRLAMTLSYSLLSFGSYKTSWFQDRWRSKDIKFFVTQSNATTEGKTRLSPYITPVFPCQAKGKSVVRFSGFAFSPAQGFVRNEKLFSLALVLTEIGLGCTLLDIEDPTGSVHGPTDDPFKEYIKSKNIVESHMLGREMGPDYARIVKQCFFCDFGIGEADFATEELQYLFYDKVVCGLERCLQRFRGV